MKLMFVALKILAIPQVPKDLGPGALESLKLSQGDSVVSQRNQLLRSLASTED